MADKIVKTVELVGASALRTATTYGAPNGRRSWLYTAANYGGTVKIYFEASFYSMSASYTAYCALYTTGGSVVSGSAVTTTSTGVTRVRSGELTLSDATSYELRQKSSSTLGGCTVISAKLIIVISGTITALMTDIDIAPTLISMTTAYVARGGRWLYTAANWDGTKTVYLEACMRSSATTRTIYACLWDLTAGAAVTGSEVSTTATAYGTRVRSGDIYAQLVDGREYEVRTKCSATNAGNYLCAGTILFQQTASPKITETRYDVANRYIYHSNTAYTTSFNYIYWDESEWGTTSKTMYFEATHNTGGVTSYVNLYGSSQLAEVSSSATTLARTRSSSFTPSDTTNHYSQVKIASTWAEVYTPAIIILALLDTTLVVGDGSHSLTNDSIALTQAHTLAIQEGSHSQTTDSIGLTEHKTLAIQEATHGLTNDSITLTQVHTLAVQECSHSHLADGDLILVEESTGVKTLEMQEASHALTNDLILLSQVHNIDISECGHVLSNDSIDLVQAYIIGIQEVYHDHFADNVVLIEHKTLAMQEANHSLTNDFITLVVAHVLAMQEVAHALSSDNIIIYKEILANEIAHLLTSDNIDIFQAHTLLDLDCIHILRGRSHYVSGWDGELSNHPIPLYGGKMKDLTMYPSKKNKNKKSLTIT